VSVPGALRVLHVLHEGRPGGAPNVLLATLRHAPVGTASAVVLLDDGPLREELAALGVPVGLVPTGRFRDLRAGRRTVGGLAAAARAHRADLVVAHVTKSHVFAAPAARVARVPEVWWQHEHLGQVPRLQALAGRIPARATICSAAWTARAQEARFPRTRAAVVHPGVEPGRFAAVRDHHAGGVPTIVLAARLARYKRVELALRALPVVRRHVPGALLRVLGDATGAVDPELPGQLRAEAQALGVAEAVDWAGWVQDVPAALAAADVLVHPAEDEPFGLALVEGQLAGLPVVAAGTGGPREIVRDGVDGLLVDVEDPQALGAALAGLLADPGRRAAMGAAGRARALERFTASRCAAGAWAVYAAAAGS
jgi:glycosyltransferase involved in cell wall biosynthesis